jgi:hypothetical protein
VPSALRLLPFHLGAKGRFDAADEIDDDARLLAISGNGRERDSSGAEHSKADWPTPPAHYHFELPKYSTVRVISVEPIDIRRAT